ncbi:MAG: Oxidoreductase [uncultured Sphingomonadaceae bacterium]|uniref:2-oxoglutarate-dependent ethylene/succinate-forming enzyme n=1 Tax=uncultured Sphingomonadaceae bacterium TaxID=169976 RepID=A0A6J4SB86_9SPHN|nr:MAG: Oxidoreductase [uncultured Sphingomonadaceae bacterium]
MLDTADRIAPLSLAGMDRDPDGFAQEFGASFARYGFAVVTDHGLDPALVARGWAATKAYFDQSEAVKRAHKLEGKAGARGYTPFGVEIAKDAAQHDLKEFFHVGRDLPPGHHLRGSMPDNVWPEQPPEFRETMQALYAAFDRVGLRLLSAIARYLRLSPDFFDDPVALGNSVLRLLHYPPVSGDAPGVRAGAHEDINLITLLLGAEEAGLEIVRPDGTWLGIAPPPDALVVNVGDMLQRLTNHVLPSTTHRVQNPASERRGHSRYSMPFFVHLRSDYEIRTLPGCVTPGNPDRYPEPILADDYLTQRLREIGLLK